MRVAYFTNQYPAVSHTFIRRELRAMEALGVTVLRYALRPGEGLVDVQDKAESRITRYILNSGVIVMVGSFLTELLSQPVAFISMVLESLKLGWNSDRGVFRHIVYALEAAVLAKWCRQDTVQHVHAHFGTNAAVIAMLAGRLSGVPYSFTAHGPEEFEKAALLSLDTKLRHSAFAVSVSSYGRSQLMRWSKPDLWSKIALVRCGVDEGFFEESAPTPPSSVSRLVCVARFGAEKGQLLLIAAVRRLLDAGIRCKVVLAGDGQMRLDIEEGIRRARLQDEVTVTGWISGDQVRAEILAAHAVVLPTFAENLPVVIMEAMALGRPIISTYVAGIPELIQPGVTGWLVPAGDEIALANAIREVLETPVEKLAAMGAASRLRVLELHNVLTEARKLKNLIEGSLSADSSLARKCTTSSTRENQSAVRLSPQAAKESK